MLVAAGCPADGGSNQSEGTGPGTTTMSMGASSSGGDPGASSTESETDTSPGATTGGSTGNDSTGADSTGSASSGSTAEGSSESTGTGASSECIMYCDEFIPNCNGIPGIMAYDDMADCLQTCAPWEHGPAGEFAGDTVECRIAHLVFDPNPGPGYYELHCFHAQETPTGQCI